MSKKIFTSLFMLMMVFMGVVSLSSCGDDNEDPTETPANSADAMKLTISDSQCPYSSIEFTETGKYFITMTGSSSSSKRFLPISFTITRSSEGNSIINGTYTKNGDTYTLSGFGTVTVAKKSDTAVSITIKKTGSEAKSYNASVVTSISNSDMTKKLCHTWVFESIEEKSMENGEVVSSFSGSYNDYIKKYNVDGEKYSTEVTFTAAGSYILMCNDNSFEVAQWKWSDEKAGKMMYCLDGEDWDNEDDTTISFSGSKMYVVTEYKDTYEDVTYYDYTKITLVKK